MEYIEAVFTISPAEGWVDIVIAELAEVGFESFEITAEGLKSWCPEKLFNRSSVEEIVDRYSEHCLISWKYGEIEPVNWNEEWEKNYQPVIVNGKCLIRAPFHRYEGDPEYDIIIEPKMSFGTAHHETTKLMIEWLLEMDLKGKKVLDMGCGTGVLAILAAKKGAEKVVAIDNYVWAYNNTIENGERNKVNIETYHGDNSVLANVPHKFDLIIANINRNVLTDDIPIYVKHLRRNGELLISGFFINDEAVLNEVAENVGASFAGSRHLGQWSSVLYKIGL